MSRPRITLLESQERSLREFLESDSAGSERAAVVLFRRISDRVPHLAQSDRFLGIEVIHFQDSWVSSSSSSHIGYRLTPLREMFRRCAEEDLVFGFVHIHPDGEPYFSDTDDDNEKTLLTALRNRNGPLVYLVSLLLTGGRWEGRVRQASAPDEAIPIRHLLVVGKPLTMYGHEDIAPVDRETWERQIAVFGRPFVSMFRSLRIGVLGAGGTGSPTIDLLARSGVGELV